MRSMLTVRNYGHVANVRNLVHKGADLDILLERLYC